MQKYWHISVGSMVSWSLNRGRILKFEKFPDPDPDSKILVRDGVGVLKSDSGHLWFWLCLLVVLWYILRIKCSAKHGGRADTLLFTEGPAGHNPHTIAALL